MNPQEPPSLDLSQPEPTTVQLSTDPRQQIIDRLTSATNVLLTVSPNPSVDQLSAAIGVTLALNKLSKHTTTVFSGNTPRAIEFLEPSKTIQKDIDSLRDFIIALDKSKADKLRYKVEDRFVKIYITPYHTNISEGDLEFGQGDYNVDVIIALGVKRREDIDQAITAHGRILHDATVISINKDQSDDIGVINWHVPGTSSYCEILFDLIDSFNTPENKLFDEQVATAFLTGIVAETERFSNDNTTPQTMSTAGILMNAGANQKLISTNLESTGSSSGQRPNSVIAPQDSPAISRPRPAISTMMPSVAATVSSPISDTSAATPTQPTITKPLVQAITDGPPPDSKGAAGIGSEAASHISLYMPESPAPPIKPKVDDIDIDSDGNLHKLGDTQPAKVITAVPAPSLPLTEPPVVDRIDQSLEEIENAINSPHLKVNGGETVMSSERAGKPTTPVAPVNEAPVELNNGQQSGLKLPNPFGQTPSVIPEPTSAPLVSQPSPTPAPVIIPTEPIVTTLPPPPASPPPMIPPVV